MFTVILAAVVSGLVVSALTFLITYVKMVRPSDAYVASLKQKLEREEQLCSDITDWVKIETRDHPRVWLAIEKRINDLLRSR